MSKCTFVWLLLTWRRILAEFNQLLIVECWFRNALHSAHNKGQTHKITYPLWRSSRGELMQSLGLSNYSCPQVLLQIIHLSFYWSNSLLPTRLLFFPNLNLAKRMPSLLLGSYSSLVLCPPTSIVVAGLETFLRTFLRLKHPYAWFGQHQCFWAVSYYGLNC